MPDAEEVIGFEEAEHRATVLEDIRRTVLRDGVHHASHDPHRAVQFMPFKALDGFDEIEPGASRPRAERPRDSHGGGVHRAT